MNKLLIRGDQLRSALAVLEFLPYCKDYRTGKAMMGDFVRGKLEEYNFSWTRVQAAFLQHGVEPRTLSAFEYNAIHEATFKCMAAVLDNNPELLEMELDVGFLGTPGKKFTPSRLFQLFASGEITEEMLKEPPEEAIAPAP